MVPPGKLKFFFSDSNTMMISKDYNAMLLENPLRIELPSVNEHKNLINISKVNVLFIETEE